VISLEFYIILDKNHLAIARRYLRKKTYLNNFHTSKEYILLSLVWVETNDVGNFSIAELFKHDLSLCPTVSSDDRNRRKEIDDRYLEKKYL